MVGDANVFVAHVPCRIGKLFDLTVAVGGNGVHVEVAFDIGEFNQLGEVMVLCRLNLAPVFAQHRDDIVEAELIVNLLLDGAGDHFVAFEQAVFV